MMRLLLRLYLFLLRRLCKGNRGQTMSTEKARLVVLLFIVKSCNSINDVVPPAPHRQSSGRPRVLICLQETLMVRHGASCAW